MMLDDMQVTVITPPATEPVTRVEAKAHLRVDVTDDDTYIDNLIKYAREQCEFGSRRAFVTQTLELRMESWPLDGDIEFPMPPLQSVTSIKWTDTSDVEHTMAPTDYVVYANMDPGVMYLKPTAQWPAGVLQIGPSIAVRFVAGYGAAAAVPASYKQAILLLVGHMYENREAVVVGTTTSVLPMAVASLLNADRVSWY
jgi:uncharacterized phiE125 gp8 family phage protein